MKLDIDRYQYTTVDELVQIGKKRGGKKKLFQCINDVQEAIGEENELHPNFMDTAFDALEKLGWDQDEFVHYMCLVREIGV